MNIAGHIERAARHFPGQPAILFEGEAAISYRDLRQRVQQVAGGLAAAGVQPGDRVALFLPNTPSFVIAYQACQWLGAITVSANVMLTTEELRYLLEDSGARLAFTTEALWPALAPLAAKHLGDLSRVVLCEGAVAGTTPLAAFGLGASTPPLAFREKDDPAAILYTSGTTGKQKGATLSIGNVVSNMEATRQYMRVDPDDRLLLFLPLFHVFGQNFIMNAAFAAGAAVVLHRRFDREGVLASIVRDRVTMFFAVPTIFIMLLDSGIRREDMPGVRYFFSAAATMPVEVAERWKAIFQSPVYEGYGLSETSPFASYNHEWHHRPGSVGAAIANVDLRIVDPEDHEVPSGTWGEICIKGPNVMLGYWNRPSESAEALRGGWFHTGDVGYMDEDGFVFIVDRTKDMINAAGFKVWPREVEEVLYQHPAVGECAVYGAPDPVKGEVPLAAVVLAAGAATTAAELEAYCRERLAAYKVPRGFDLVPALPKSATGKILKRVLRDEVARQPVSGR
ncbi:MAG: long-chain fatty acid--CoA ligase [Chloroflexi bacterium]|nr:long-chain fatty acid--CoA ligase [Chloroflexota bacterium]